MSTTEYVDNIAASTENLTVMRKTLQQFCNKCDIDKTVTDKIVIGVNEACMNIIKHAYKGLDGEIILAVKLMDNKLRFQLTDFAEPIDVRKIKSRKLEEIRPGGLGVHFIHELMDEVEYIPSVDGKGNKLLMEKNI